MSISVQNIRNVCLLGHSGSGKTALTESMLFLTGAIDRMGRAADGNTVSDYDAEEKRRQISLSTTVIPVDYKGVHINVLDVPGAFDFVGEAMEALAAADAAILVCSAKDGISVGFEKAWRYCKDRGTPCFIYVSKADEDNADFNGTVASLRDTYGSSVIAVTVPDAAGAAVLDVISGKTYGADKAGKLTEQASDELAGELDGLREALYEGAAAADEELMEKYFEAMELTPEETVRGLKAGILTRDAIPVYGGSAVNGVGTLLLLDGIVALAPDPSQTADVKVEEGELKFDPAGSPVAFVFKTVSDQYGKYSFIKVLSGTITPDLTLTDSRTGSAERLGRLYSMRGNKATEIKDLGCGEIGAIGKMDRVRTGDTLSDAKNPVTVAPIPFAEPCYSVAIAPKTRGQDDKVAQGLSRLNEEDPSFSVYSNPETHQMVLSGSGDVQVDVLVSKLKSRFNVEVELSPVRVAYREKIRKTVEKQGRHKKQTGGSGQFGDVWIRFEPNLDEEEMVFAEEVFGGSVPKNYFPAVEKGLREACVHGPLAGYPVVNLKAVLYDGSYHPVDSSEIAFKTAAQLAYKAAMPLANPVLMEPVGELKVTVPDSYMGDVMGDLNKRRGRIMGMDPLPGGEQMITAEVPIGEMGSYAIDLRSMTQSRGSFTLHFVRYEDCPPAAQEKAIAEAKALAEEQ